MRLAGSPPQAPALAPADGEWIGPVFFRATREGVARFAAAVGHRDRACRTGLRAPFTFPASLRLELPALAGDRFAIVLVSEEIELARDILAGDRLACTATLRDVAVRQGRRGAYQTATQRVEGRDDRGRIVFARRTDLRLVPAGGRREGGDPGAGGLPAPPAPDPLPSPVGGPGGAGCSPPLRLAGGGWPGSCRRARRPPRRPWRPGAGLRPATVGPLSMAAILAYAEASGDHNPVHLDPVAARRAGFAAPVAHGLLTMACAAGWLQRRTLGWELRRLRMDFLRPVYAGQRLRFLAEPRSQAESGANGTRVRIAFHVDGATGETLARGSAELTRGPA